MEISGRRRTWLQVGRLSVLGILTVIGMLTMGEQNLTAIYAAIAICSVLSAVVSNFFMNRYPESGKHIGTSWSWTLCFLGCSSM